MSVFYGCNADNEPNSSNQLHISLSLFPSSLSTRTDNSPAISQSNGNTIENTIDINNLFIALYDPDGNPVTVIFDSANNVSSIISPTDSSLDIETDLSISEYSGNLQLAAVANVASYGITPDFSKLTLAELKSLTFSFPPDNEENSTSLIPMFGEKEVELNNNNNYTNFGQLNMVRALSKIEIINNLPDGWQITNAKLAHYSTIGTIASQLDPSTVSDNQSLPVDNKEKAGIDLTFKESADNSFYVYVPEMSLPSDPKGEERRIDLTLINGKEEKICHLWIAPYADGEPTSSEDPIWQTILRNHIYRFFITSLIPSLEISSTIKIIWCQPANGKFSNPFINFKTTDNKNDDPLLGRNKNGGAKEENIWYDPLDQSTLNAWRSFTLDLANYNVTFQSLRYQLLPTYGEEMDSDLSSVLHEDVVKLENRDGITFCWLTTPTLASHIKLTDIPTNAALRIYWKDKSNTETIFINNRTDYQAETDSRSYKYTDFNLQSIYNGKTKISYEIGKSPFLISGVINLTDLFIQNIDGEDYYVFYVN